MRKQASGLLLLLMAFVFTGIMYFNGLVFMSFVGVFAAGVMFAACCINANMETYD